MENASKALIIAGEVLIGILLVSLMVYLFTVMRGPAEEYFESISDEEVARFNVAFERLIPAGGVSPAGVSLEGRHPTMQDIVSLRNFAIDSFATFGGTQISLNTGGASGNIAGPLITSDGARPTRSDEELLRWALGATVTNDGQIEEPRFRMENVQRDLQQRGRITSVTFTLNQN